MAEVGHTEERHQPDQRPHAQCHTLAGRLQLIIVKPGGLIVEPRAAKVVHGIADGHKVLEELAGDAFVGHVHVRQLNGQLEHVIAEESHPGSAVALL